MSTRRMNGEGSIVWHKAKNRYVVSISIPGERIYRYRKTRSEAVAELNSLRAKYGLVKYDANLTLEAWYLEWLFETKASSLKPRSIADYHNVFNRHIKPYPIAKMKISEITKTDVTRLFNQLAHDNRSIQTIKKVKLRLTACFNGADDYVSKNPVSRATLPKAYNNERVYTQDKQKPMLGDEGKYNVFTEVEQKKLIEVLNRSEDWYCDFLILFMLGTGLRLGEALALRYNFNIRDKSVIVRKGVQRTPIYEDRKVVRYGRIEDEPKTKTSERIVPLPLVLQVGISKRIEEIKAKSSDPYFHDRGLLFPNEDGDYLNDRRVLRRIKSIEKSLSLSNINLHGLRHSYATRLLENGEPIQVISELLGHKNIDVTQTRYSHVLTKMKERAVKSLDSILTTVGQQ